MKKSINKNFTINLLSVLLLAGWGTKEDETAIAGGGKKPSVNFYGIIIDNTETAVQAQYITVSGLYRQVPVYLIPKDLHKKDYTPTDNIARLDLAEISQINILDCEKTYTFSGRTYVEIEIISNDQKTKNIYMIESSKKIYFDELNESGPIERELMLTAVKQVIIEGYTAATQEQKTANCSASTPTTCIDTTVCAQAPALVNKSCSIEDLCPETEYVYSSECCSQDLTNGL